MEKYTTNLLANMHLELQKVALEAENKLQLAEHSFHIVESHIKNLKEFITGYQFKDKQEEIRFFKEIKPKFKKELVYSPNYFPLRQINHRPAKRNKSNIIPNALQQ